MGVDYVYGGAVVEEEEAYGGVAAVGCDVEGGLVGGVEGGGGEAFGEEEADEGFVVVFAGPVE